MWKETIKSIARSYDVELEPPLDEKSIRLVTEELELGEEFIDLYSATNGLSLGWFRVLPIQDSVRIKKTWDGLQRANDPKTSKYELDEEFLGRFVVFAETGPGECAVWDKTDGTIWYEEGEEYHQTNLSLKKFVELCLREVTEL